MRAIHLDNDASVGCSRISRFDPREGDVQIASPNRLSLLSLLCSARRDDRSQHYAIQMRLGANSGMVGVHARESLTSCLSSYERCRGRRPRVVASISAILPIQVTLITVGFA